MTHNNPTHIIIHHSATEDSDTLSWSVIRQYHMRQGWSNIGYHEGIERVRGSEEILIGRFHNQEGAHCPPMNRRSIGICVVGNYDRMPPPPRVWLLVLRRVRYLMRAYQIPRENVLGHREVAGVTKSCPGEQWDMDGFRSAL